MSFSKNINPSLVLVQPRKTRPFITERLLMGRKEPNQTNQKSTDDKMKRDMEASVTLETVSPAVEGSSENSHTYWEVTV